MAVQPLDCPGSRSTAVQLTNEVTTSAGIGHPSNTGDCRIFINALDASGRSVQEVTLDPGQSLDWVAPPPGAVSIWVVCHSECSGRGELTYDTPVA